MTDRAAAPVGDTGPAGEAPAGGGRRRLRPSRVLLAAAAVILLAAVAVGAPSGSLPALDPHSTAPDGTKALVLLLQRLGADVRVGPVEPPSSHGVAVVLQDRLNDTDRAALHRWVDAGGELVVTDTLSPLAGVSVDPSSHDAQEAATVAGRTRRWPACDLPSVRGVSRVDTGGAALLAFAPGQVACFPAGRGAFLVARTEGTGIVVVVAAPTPWTNAYLATADDSVVAAGLLAPRPGTVVTVIGASPVGGGHQGLLGLVSPHVIEAFWGLLGAFALVVLWRARRLGRPVPDPVPVELPGSALVAATGNLLQEGGHRERAAGLLRDDVRRLLTDRLGIDPDLPAESIAAVAAARTGAPVERILEALDGPTPASDAALVAWAQTVEEIRQEVSSAR